MQDAIDIKVLQTLGMAGETLSHARVACEGPRPTVLRRVLGMRFWNPNLPLTFHKFYGILK